MHKAEPLKDLASKYLILGFTMHALIMMSVFLPPVFHAGFGYLVSGQKLLNKPRYFLEIATAGFLLHSTGLVAVLVGMFTGEFNSG